MTVGLCALLVTPALCQDAPYRAGTTSYNGHAVNAYTNAGAAEYRRTIRTSRGGGIKNIVRYKHPRQKRSLARLKVPKVYSFKASAYKKLPKRKILVEETSYSFGKKIRRTKSVDLSALIAKEAEKHNVDPLLVEVLIRHESNFRNEAVSRTGAQGLMQLMPGTAKMLGVSNSHDPGQNVAGGTYYLAQQLSTFKDLKLALAAYNAGPNSVRKFGGVPPYVETQNYVYKIVREYSAKQKLVDSKKS